MDFRTDTYPTPTYTDKQAARIMAALDDIRATLKSTKCVSCGAELFAGEGVPTDQDFACIYDHDGGVGLIGDIPKQWVSFECGCGYHTSLPKLMRHGM